MNANKQNACGGNYQDWLEVYLTSKCNGSCEWCIDKGGYHPEHHALWQEIASAVFLTGRENILLVGGEPTLYDDIQPLIKTLASFRRNVFVTTNGSMLDNYEDVDVLNGVKGVNISFHDIDDNKSITGLRIRPIHWLVWNIHDRIRASVRLNCNLIKGHVDSAQKVIEYINFARESKADSVRFSELAGFDSKFVSLTDIFKDLGFNEDPFSLGCSRSVEIDGMPVSFKQMCGFYTKHRPMPTDPVCVKKKVLYYDGIVYDGWKKESEMKTNDLRKLLVKVRRGEVDVDSAERIVREMTGDSGVTSDGCSGVRYSGCN